jgi:sec-independent protein translocase protein TatB
VAAGKVLCRKLTGHNPFSMKFAFVSAVRGQVSLPFMRMPPTIEFASLGMWDSLILMVMALVVFGPRRLPEIGRQIGRLMYEARKLSNEFKFQMEEEFRKAEEAGRQKTEELRLAASALTAGPSEAVDPAAIVAASEPTAEEAYPRILPPSTGGPVAAARPGGIAAGVQPGETSWVDSQVSESRPGAPEGLGGSVEAIGAQADAGETAPATDGTHMTDKVHTSGEAHHG